MESIRRADLDAVASILLWSKVSWLSFPRHVSISHLCWCFLLAFGSIVGDLFEVIDCSFVDCGGKQRKRLLIGGGCGK